MQIQGTKDIIKILPLDEALKSELLAKFDSLAPGVKEEMTDVLWDAYDAFYDLKLNKNIHEGLIDGANGQGELDQAFYNRMVEKTEKEMQDSSVQSAEKVDLSQTRAALETLLNGEKQPQSN